ncbi:MAG: ROK family protein, partial [Actinomycetota bacterium]|nr:ROK family protein [Actinomycetota bacterium]
MKTKEKDCVIGVDVGGTKIASGLVDQRGKLILRIEVDTPFHDGNLTTEALKEVLHKCMRAAKERELDVEGVGIGVAGYVLAETGFLISSPNINWSMVPLQQIVAEFTNLPTIVDNDAAVAAIGEHFAGAAKGARNFVLLTVGTGVGGGVFINGKLYRGSRGTAAEVGHMVVEPYGPLCGC